MAASDLHALPEVSIPELAHRLRLVVGRLNRRLRHEGGYQMGASAFTALATVERLGSIPIGDLARTEQVRPPTMTGIVASLEEAELVIREMDPADRRQVRVRITLKGRAQLAAARERKVAYLVQRLAALTPEDLALLDSASTLLERLGAGDS